MSGRILDLGSGAFFTGGFLVSAPHHVRAERVVYAPAAGVPLAAPLVPPPDTSWCLAA